MWWLVVSSIVASPVHAAPSPAVDAERDRILAELQQLEARGIWKGVDRSYVRLEGLLARGSIVSAEAHLAGAEAARTLGDIAALVTRLERAGAAGADVRAALDSIQQRFTRVHLVAPRRLGAALQSLRNPFELDARRAIEVARDALTTTGTHEGYLPVGEYSLGGIPFEVHQSEDIVSVTLERGAKRTRANTPVDAANQTDSEPMGAQTHKAATTAARTLGLHLAALAGGGAATAARSGVQPPPASGLTPGLTVSTRLSLSGPWALETGLGYRGLLGSSSSNNGQQVLHLGAAQARLGWTSPDWSVFAGPLLARGIGRAMGLDTVALAACSDAERCGAMPSNLAQPAAQSLPLDGTIGGAGATIGVEHRVVPAFEGLGLGLEIGWIADGQRSLLWTGLQATLHWTLTP